MKLIIFILIWTAGICLNALYLTNLKLSVDLSTDEMSAFFCLWTILLLMGAFAIDNRNKIQK